MIKSLILALFLFVTIPFSSNNGIENNNVITEISDPVHYRDLGSYRQEYSDGSVIHVDAFIIKKLNHTGAYTNYRYQYELTLKSQSVHNGYYTQTWLYGARFYYNGQEISYNQYPNGATLYIGTAPTGVYSWFTSEEEIAKFTVSWVNAAYEPRTR